MIKSPEEMMNVKWKLIKPVKTGHYVIVPASWRCKCDKTSEDYTGEFGCLCYHSHEVGPFYSDRKAIIGRHIVKLHNASLNHE